MDKSLSTWELYSQTYPRDGYALDNLAGAYASRGQFEKALQVAQQQLEALPDDAASYALVSEVYRAMNRLDEAKATVEAGLKHDSGGGRLPFQRLLVALAQGDQVAAEAARTQIRGNPQGKMYLAALEGTACRTGAARAAGIRAGSQLAQLPPCRSAFLIRLPWPGASLRGAERQRKKSRSLSGFLCALERRRSRCADSERGQG